MRRGLALAILLALWLPSGAFAGSASLVVARTGTFANRTLIYTAPPGERNQIVVGRELTITTNAVVLHDGGAAVVAGSGCTSIDARTVRCAAEPAAFPGGHFSQPMPDIAIDAGDGDDTVTSSPSSVRMAAHGGEGEDRLTGAGTLSGGPGRDLLIGSDAGALDKGSEYSGETLIGGPGEDVLRGGGGFDTLIGDGGNPGNPDPGGADDVIDGGADRDSVRYSTRRAGMRIDLAAETMDGAGGEHDRLTGIENVVGGEGDDVLLGDDAGNQLTGGAGDDRLEGRGGNDRLVDIGPGADTLRGDAGEDKVYAPGRRDKLFGGAGNDMLSSDFDGDRLLARTLRCGSGHDRVRGRPQGQLLDDCEQVDLNPPHIGPTVSVRPRERPRGALRFVWSCYGPDILIGCEMAVTLRLRSSSTRRNVSIPKVAGRIDRRSFDMRTARSARRRDVLGVAISGGLDYGDRGGTFLYGARWRVRLRGRPSASTGVLP